MNLPRRRRRYMTETNARLHERQQMPNFELPDEEGSPFNLLKQLEAGPLVLVFYRGDW
jgi:peroxiredoxin